MRNSIKIFIFYFFLLCINNHLLAQEFQFKGLDFDDDGYEKVLKKAKLTRGLESLPANASLKMYAPYPKSQGQHGTCTAWATSYCGRTIVEAIKKDWKDRNYITENAYSPAFLFRLILPKDTSCEGGSAISSAFDILKEKGVARYKDVPGLCIPAVTQAALTKASDEKIKDFLRLFDVETANKAKIEAVKKSLSEKKPVVCGITCPPSFSKVKELWEPTEEPLKSYGGHAICVIGYDDEKFGGAFEIQNSWGTRWANQGYCWIKYEDYARFTRYAYEFVDLPVIKPAVPDLSGSIKLMLADGNPMPTALFVSTRGLIVVPAKTAQGPLTLYRTLVPYTSGTRFRIYISNNQPAYVYAISTDLSNEITKIFPYEEGISAALTDKKSDVAIPDEDHFIEFDNKPGKDLLCVLYSRDELNINDLVQKISAQQGSFSERIFKVIGDKIVDPKNIAFSKENISFEGFSKGKSIVPMMVELEHK